MAGSTRRTLAEALAVSPFQHRTRQTSILLHASPERLQFTSASDWLGNQTTLLPREAGIADLNQGWLRSCAALKVPLQRSSLAGTAQGSSCNRSWQAGAIESVEEYGCLLVGCCQSQAPHAPTEATQGTCCMAVDSSGTAPDHRHRAID